MRPTEQIYGSYTEEDFLVWKTLFNRQMQTLKSTVSEAYLNALEKVKFSPDRIPHFKEIEEILKPLTGWAIQVVPNISPQKIFFELLTKRNLPPPAGCAHLSN